jgi:hypothetical protein
MEYNTQNHWVFGLRPLSGILETSKQCFGNWICFCPWVRGEWKTPTLLGPLERANPNHWRLAHSKGPNRVGVFHSPLTRGGNRSSFRNVVFSSFYNTAWWTKPKNPLIPVFLCWVLLFLEIGLGDMDRIHLA